MAVLLVIFAAACAAAAHGPSSNRGHPLQLAPRPRPQVALNDRVEQVPAAVPLSRPSPRAGDTLSVLDFGAKADGRTDDSVAIQKAVDAAQAQSLPLLIPAGTYRLASTVVVRADVKPKAAASGASRRGARIAARRLAARASAAQEYSALRMIGDGIEESIMVAGAPMDAVLSLPNISQFIEFSHFGIDGNKSAQIGIDAPNTLIRSRFTAVGVNHSRTAGIRACARTRRRGRARAAGGGAGRGGCGARCSEERAGAGGGGARGARARGEGAAGARRHVVGALGARRTRGERRRT